MESCQKRTSSFQKKAILTISIIVIPLFISIALFIAFTVHNQNSSVRNARLNTLSAYQVQLQNTIQTTESYLKNTVSNDLDFQAIVYADNKTEAYVSSAIVAKTLQPLLQANELIGGFYTYSGTFDYFRANNITSYPLSDALLIRSAVIQAASGNDTLSDWNPIQLSDRTVLLSTAARQNTVIAAVIDPSRQHFADLEEGSFIFPVLPDGSALTATLPFPLIPVSAFAKEHFLLQDTSGKFFDALILPSTDIGGFVVHAQAYSISQYWSFPQVILLLIALLLLSSIPIYWTTFQRVLLEPLNNLTEAMHAIQQGNTDIRIPPVSKIDEVNEISETVNTILDILRQQKIDFYEQQLKTQHAQLQYLQLQIRPHFYLNCLNIIFSMAEEKNYSGIQDVVLNLSSYLRNMFHDNMDLVPLISELHSVESYIQIQQIGTEKQPQYKLELDPQITETRIPPLSILTFVENSFKHSQCVNEPIEIQIKCKQILSEDGCWLNITISDNCGGVSETQLKQLNSISRNTNQETHIGILNTKQRIQLLYGDKATLSFRNKTNGLCVELFIPLDERNGGTNR